MSALDRESIVDEVRRLLPNAESIALTGSAAFRGEHFRAHSDIDIIAINSRECMAWSEVDGHEMVIGAVCRESVDRLVLNPQHFTPGWVFRVGMVARAEILFGPPLRQRIRSQITRRTWLVAASGLLGLLLMAEKKARSGRRAHFNESIIDVPIVLTALRQVFTRTLPNRCEPDANLADKGPLSDFSEELEEVRTFAASYRDILEDTTRISKLCSSLPHRTGLEWMRQVLQIDVPMPEVST